MARAVPAAIEEDIVARAAEASAPSSSVAKWSIGISKWRMPACSPAASTIGVAMPKHPAARIRRDVRRGLVEGVVGKRQRSGRRLGCSGARPADRSRDRRDALAADPARGFDPAARITQRVACRSPNLPPPFVLAAATPARWPGGAADAPTGVDGLRAGRSRLSGWASRTRWISTPAVQGRSVISPNAAAVALGGDLPPVQALGAYIAAIREAFEEVGILLAEGPGLRDIADARERLLGSPSAWPSIVEGLDLRLRTDLLVPLSRWVTPRTLPRRFDTRFFAAVAPEGVEVSLVGEEVAAHAWHRPKDALHAMAAGHLEMWVPTSSTLAQLAYVGSIDDIREGLSPGPLGEVEVEGVATDIVRIQMPAGGGVAGQPIDSYLVGRKRFVLVDPGDPTGDGLYRAVEEAERRGGTIEAIALTCAEPDHAAGAEFRSANSLGSWCSAVRTRATTCRTSSPS